MSYDWDYIRLRFESGETAYSISKAMGGKPSKQGIQQRANKEGWSAPDSATGTLPIVAAALNVDSRKLTDELLRIVLGLIGQGATEGLACQAVGIAQNTWTNWKKQDQRLQDAVNRARAGKVSEWIGHIDKAAPKDWKAAQALLRASPETANTFSSSGNKDDKLEVIININRDGPNTPRNIIEVERPAITEEHPDC